MQDVLTVEDFRELAPRYFDILEECGFVRRKEMESYTPKFSADLVYSGKCFAFVISYNAKERCVDDSVVVLKNGTLHFGVNGGYSQSVFGYLIEYEKYRGHPFGMNGRDIANMEVPSYERELLGIVNLLKTAGGNLLAKSEESLL